MTMTNPDWSAMDPDEKRRRLEVLAGEGLAASQIAKRFYGASRNAVIGQLARWKIPLANAVGNRPEQTRERKTRVPAPRPIGNRKSKPLPPPPPKNPGTAMTYLDALDAGKCRWPLWSEWEGPTISLCCGADRTSGSYCEFHADLAVGNGTESERSAHRSLEGAA